MSKAAESWLTGGKVVYLYSRKDVPEQTVSLPLVAFGDALPSLILVESTATGRRALAKTSSWGNPAMPADADGVRVHPTMLKSLQRRGEGAPAQRNVPAKLHQVRWHHVLVYKKGYLVTVGILALGALAGIGGAVTSFLGDEAPRALEISALVLVIASLLAVAIRNAVKGAGKP